MWFEIMSELHIFNYDTADRLLVAQVECGTFKIEDGVLRQSFLREGQRYAIVGSVLNDGVYEYGYEADLQDEVFTGKVYALRRNPAFERIVNLIMEDCAKNGEVSEYTSESFGGYSYTKNADAAKGWRGKYAAQLAPFRKW